MTKKIELKSQTRTEVDINLVDMRNAGFVPGIIYGSDIENTSLKLNRIELEKVFKVAGESTLVDLQIDDRDATKVIIKDIQIDAIKDRIIHADFYQVDMKKSIEVEIPFVFIGEAKAEKEQGALILKNMESVLVKCLPGDLVENFEIDISKLEKIGDSIKVSDLELPESYELLSGASNAIVNATEHKIEVEEETTEKASDDVEGEEKKEEEAGEEEKKEEKK